MARSVLVVAQFEEDISWTKHLPGRWELLVVKKGDQIPNEGREASSYCWAFQQEWDDCDILACVQGDPFAHCSSLVRQLYFPPSSFKPLGGWETTTGGDGSPHHGGIPVAERYEEWFGDDFPGSLDFTTGGQFFVSGAELKNKDWQLWYDRSCTEYGPWLMERFWRKVFEK